MARKYGPAQKAYQKAYCLAHRVEIRAQKKRWAAANPKKVRDYKFGWYMRNRKALNERSRKWRAEHPERNKELVNTWHKAHPARVSQFKRSYRKHNPDRIARLSAERRAAKAGAVVKRVDRLAILAANQGICVYCKKRKASTLDHIIPLTRGDPHIRANLVGACGKCNSAKGNRLLSELSPGWAKRIAT